MSSPLYLPSRRLFLASAATSAVLPWWTVKGAFADELTRTPDQTEGPFYPNKLPLDTDNDLHHHQRQHHAGRRRDHAPDGQGPRRQGQPGQERGRRDLAVRRQRRLPAHRRQRREAGQAGQELPGLRAVRHRARPASTTSARSSRCPTPAARRTSTSRSRRDGRACSTRSSTSRRGQAATRRTASTGRCSDEKQRAAITVPFEKVKDSKIGELAANFVIVLGVTPAE